MVIKKILLPLLCITTCISVKAMQGDTLHPIIVRQLQSRYPQWQKVTQTPEFLLCTTLLKQNHSSSQEYEKAFQALMSTKEFKKYEMPNNPLKNKD